MAEQILFFQKAKSDFTDSAVNISASQANEFIPLVLNRSNLNAWITTGSVDADNTQIDLDLGNFHTLTDLFLIKHNFKSYTAKYWNGSSYVDFSPAIAPTTSTDETTRHSFAQVETDKIRIIITGTQIPNSEKQLFQLVVTELLGQLNAWPVIKKPVFDKNKRVSKMLSGKLQISENLGAFTCDLETKSIKDSDDLTLIETLFNSTDSFLVWLCGGDQTQFSSVRQGYRLEDLFLMKPTNSLQPEWYSGFYKSGMVIPIILSEVAV